MNAARGHLLHYVLRCIHFKLFAGGLDIQQNIQ